MKSFSLFLFSFLLSVFSFTQTACLTIGGSGDDEAFSLLQTTDGGYVMTGYTTSFGAGSEDMYVVKLNSFGAVQWTRTVGGTGSDYGSSIAQAADGGFVIAGATGSFGGGSLDVYVVKLNSGGTVLWTKTFGSTTGEYAISIFATRDSGFVIGGNAGVWGCVLKIDSIGTLEWSKTLLETQASFHANYIESIIQTYDGSYVFAGWDYDSTFDRDIYVGKLDSSGVVQWVRTIGGGQNDYGYSILQNHDSTYTISGMSISFGDSYLVTIDENGGLIWAKDLPNAAAGWTNSSLCKTSDSGLVVAGYATLAGSKDFFIGKMNSIGAIEWSVLAGKGNDEKPRSIIQTLDGGYALAGMAIDSIQTDIFFVKIMGDGSGCCVTDSLVTTITAGYNTTNRVFLQSTISGVDSGGVVGTGGFLTAHCSTLGIEPINGHEGIVIFPNPTTGVINIQCGATGMTNVTVYSVLGQKIAESEISAGHSVIDISSESPGVYFIHAKTKDAAYFAKIIKQ